MLHANAAVQDFFIQHKKYACKYNNPDSISIESYKNNDTDENIG